MRVNQPVTAVEHLGAFASPLGVRILVENLTSAPTTPEHLIAILQTGHLDRVGVTLDLGHAHMTVGVMDAIATLGSHIASLHVHDNHGISDEHLWPGDGTIDWGAALAALNALAKPPAAVLEISHTLSAKPEELPDRIQKAFARFE